VSSHPQKPRVLPPDQWAHRRGEPRTFAAAWVAYLFGGVAIALLGVGTMGLVATDVYRAAARLMIAITFVAIWIFWPMLRLSQERPRRVVSAFAADFLLVVIPSWAIVWPQTLAWMAAWPPEVCLGLSLLLTAWSALVAAVLTWYFGRGPIDEDPAPSRWIMMVAFVLIACIGPALSIASGAYADKSVAIDLFGMSSPVGGAMQLVADQSAAGAAASMTKEHWVFVLSLLAGSLLTWGLAVFAAREEA